MGHALQPVSCGITHEDERERPSLRARLLLRSGMYVWIVVVVTLGGGGGGVWEKKRLSIHHPPYLRGQEKSLALSTMNF